jgi:hypothetical protein
MNSSRVNGGAVRAILGICSYGGRDQAEFVATIKLVQSPVLTGISENQRPRLHHWYWGERDIDDLDDQERLVAEIVTGIIFAKIAA